MISIEDCIALSGLTSDEIDAIGEHEHVLPGVAAAVASPFLRYEANLHVYGACEPGSRQHGNVRVQSHVTNRASRRPRKPSCPQGKAKRPPSRTGRRPQS